MDAKPGLPLDVSTPVEPSCPRGAVALLTVAEAAEMLKVHANTVYELVRRGQLPHVRVGRQIRLPLATLIGWIETQSVRSLEHPNEESI